MNTFTIFGCSYSYGAGLYYYEWLKDKPDGFRIPKENDMWVSNIYTKSFTKFFF